VCAGGIRGVGLVGKYILKFGRAASLICVDRCRVRLLVRISRLSLDSGDAERLARGKLLVRSRFRSLRSFGMAPKQKKGGGGGQNAGKKGGAAANKKSSSSSGGKKGRPVSGETFADQYLPPELVSSILADEEARRTPSLYSRIDLYFRSFGS